MIQIFRQNDSHKYRNPLHSMVRQTDFILFISSHLAMIWKVFCCVFELGAVSWKQNYRPHTVQSTNKNQKLNNLKNNDDIFRLIAYKVYWCFENYTVMVFCIQIPTFGFILHQYSGLYLPWPELKPKYLTPLSKRTISEDKKLSFVCLILL